MRVIVSSLLGLLLALSLVSAADAGNLWHHFWNTFDETHRWPKPQDTVDRHAVRSVWRVMQRNGWQLHNTLGHELFDSDDHDLTVTGKRRVQRIATQAPRKRRVIFVLRGRDQFATKARINSVETELAAYDTDRELPRVRLSNRQPYRGSGEHLFQVHQQFHSSQPSPRLPALSNGNAPGN